jgi:ribonucleoside-diphosphate reductase alpha chain
MAGVRTGTRQFVLCLIDVGDDLDSIYPQTMQLVDLYQEEQNWIEYGRIRSHGSSIRKGEATHTGIIPF